MAQPNKRRIRLRRIVRRKRLQIGTGDGGAYSDKFIIVTKPQNDSTLTIKDTATIARPMNQ